MTLHLHAPQLIWLCLITVGVLNDVRRHGQLKTGFHNAWWNLVGLPIGVGLLWWGGFFRP